MKIKIKLSLIKLNFVALHYLIISQVQWTVQKT